MLGNPNNTMCFGLDVFLPGPDRKRTTAPYHYHLTYRRPELELPGCLMTWEVHGGRSPYQLALEREDGGALQIHCTCGDAVFRGDQPGHLCKHVIGFLQMRELVPQPQVNWKASA